MSFDRAGCPIKHMTSPLTSTLAKVNAQSPYFKLHLGMSDEPGWRLANDIVCDEAWLIDHLAQMQAKLPYMPKHMVALNFFSGYAWYLAAAGAACFLLDGRVPDLTIDNTAFKLDEQGWVRGTALLGDGFACLPNDIAGLQDAQVLADRETLRRHLVAQIWDNMRQLIPNIRTFVPTSEHSLQNVVANALASTALWVLQSMNLHGNAAAESRAMAAALPFRRACATSKWNTTASARYIWMARCAVTGTSKPTT